MDLDGLAAVMEGVRNKTPGLRSRALSGPHPYEQIPDLVTRSELRVRNFYSDLDSRLATVVFVAGDQFSVADITALVTVDFATKGFGMPVPVTHLALTRWYGMICARASATA